MKELLSRLVLPQMPPALDPSFAPAGETENDLWQERSLLNGIVLANVAYGKRWSILKYIISQLRLILQEYSLPLFTIAVQCFHGLLQTYRRTRTIPYMISTYVGVMSVMATAAIATQNLFNQWCFIDFRGIYCDIYRLSSRNLSKIQRLSRWSFHF